MAIVNEMYSKSSKKVNVLKHCSRSIIYLEPLSPVKKENEDDV